MSPDNKEVEKKLLDLESDLNKKSNMELPMSVSSQELIKTNSPTTIKDDLYYFSGLALIGFAVLVFFQHVHVGTGFLQALGMGAGGFGLLLIPMLVGIGLIVYNTKNKIGYWIVSITCALVFYSVLSALIMTFTPVSLLGLIIMLVPLAIGGAFVIKGMGGPKGIEYKLREQGLIKSDMEAQGKDK